MSGRVLRLAGSGAYSSFMYPVASEKRQATPAADLASEQPTVAAQHVHDLSASLGKAGDAK